MQGNIKTSQTSHQGNEKALLTVVIPIFNEEDSLPGVLKELIPYCKYRNWDLVLVDDGSRDTTPQILNEYLEVPGVTILHHKLNRGYGGALKSGMLAVKTVYLVTLDADGQHILENVDEILKFGLASDADLVIGKRGRTSSSGIYRGLGKWLIRAFASLLMPINVSDLNSGFKLYRTELVQNYLSLCPDSMAFSDVITLVFIKKRALVLEHPISINQRIAGKSTVTTYTALQTLMEIINITMLFNPLRIFLPLAISCIAFGFAWGIPIMLRNRGVSVGAMLAIVTGLLFFFIGLIAEQLSALRMGMLENKKNSLPTNDEK